MSQINCVNLLAFIQIAIAFDFGLLYLQDHHIFKSFHANLITHLNKKTLETQKLVEERLTQLQSVPGHSSGVEKANLRSHLNKLKHLTDCQQANWSKYAYIGIGGGLYGVLSLLLIGLSGSSLDNLFRDFLLISGEIILLWEFIALFQIRNARSSGISLDPLIRKSAQLIFGLIIVFIFVYVGWFFRIFPNFQLPFICILILVVYLPFFVYAWKVNVLKYKIKKAEKICKQALC